MQCFESKALLLFVDSIQESKNRPKNLPYHCYDITAVLMTHVHLIMNVSRISKLGDDLYKPPCQVQIKGYMVTSEGPLFLFGVMGL